MLRKTVREGLLGAIGNKPDYQVRLLAANWYDKGVLELSDLEEINAAIEANKPEEEPTTGEA